ncbi:MAG: fumarate hydratase C-terminal domain-containing protein [Lentisphaerae bacterium]|nr:fumarate hydratase C-terminal domain-containing protein [Lentisphaerota bacterium]
MATVIEYPFTESKVRALRVGEHVHLRGVVYTGRDRLHRRLFDGGSSPVDLKDAAIFHSGPVAMRKEGTWVIRAAGPTTSMRLEPYMPAIIERFGVRVIVGKGGMGEGTRLACVRHGCVYVQAVGGAASVLASRISEVPNVHFLKEFGMSEALWELVVEELQGVVTIDSRGRSLHKRVRQSSRRALRDLHSES